MRSDNINTENLLPLKVVVPGTEYWKKQIKCQNACPVHTDARGYIRAIAAGNFEEAYWISRAPNPLAALCGRVCGAPCEVACRRGDVDQPLAIRPLKRSALEEGHKDQKITHEDVIERISKTEDSRICSDVDDIGRLFNAFKNGKFKKVEGVSVGIIGSGPGGLSCAHDLALMGFSVVVYEMDPVLAGMLYVGVPAYRLPRELIEDEILVIKDLGVQFQTNCEVGKDVTLDELKQRHDYLVIAVGLRKSRTVPVPGHDAEGVIGGVEFLRNVALKEPHKIGKKVVVIGGGNVAYDVARTALRRQQMDVISTLRSEEEGVEAVLCCLEPRDQMFADEIEILEGEEEGVRRVNGYGPQEILTENGKVKGVVFFKVIHIFDENKRFNPKYDPNDKLILEADTVLMAIGQRSDLSFIDPEKHGININPNGVIVKNPETNETTADGIFLAGDLATGPKLMIDSIADGKKTARAIYNKRTGGTMNFGIQVEHIPLAPAEYRREKGYEAIKRTHLDVVPVVQRIYKTDILIEKGFSSSQAMVESSRCYDCGINTIFDSNLCILCGACAEICPELCLKLVPVSELEGDKSFDELVSVMKTEKRTDELTAIIKDEERCIRCALCAIRCPADAITMEKFTFKEQFV